MKKTAQFTHQLVDGHDRMHRVNVKREIEAPIADVWEIVADYGNVAVWNPLLRASRLLDGPPRGKGAERQCDMADGKNYLRERVTEWQEGQFVEVELYETTMPLSCALARVELEARGPSRTVVSMTMHFQPSGGALARSLAGLMMKPMFRRMFRKLASALKTHAEGVAAENRHLAAA